MKEVTVFTDGAYSDNPGPGDWGAILRFGAYEKELSGGEASTTNNRMELSAVIAGLSALKEPCRVTVVTDSKYVYDGMTKGWAEGWRRRGWRRADGSPALNSDLWERLLDLAAKHDVSFCWVKGHSGHPENERCDRLAVAQYEKYK